MQRGQQIEEESPYGKGCGRELNPWPHEGTGIRAESPQTANHKLPILSILKGKAGDCIQLMPQLSIKPALFPYWWGVKMNSASIQVGTFAFASR